MEAAQALAGVVDEAGVQDRVRVGRGQARREAARRGGRDLHDLDQHREVERRVPEVVARREQVGEVEEVPRRDRRRAVGIHPLEITQQPPAHFSAIGFGPAASVPTDHRIDLTLIEAKHVELPLIESRPQIVYVAATGAVEAWLHSPTPPIFEAQSAAEVLPTLGAPISGFEPSMSVPT